MGWAQVIRHCYFLPPPVAILSYFSHESRGEQEHRPQSGSHMPDFAAETRKGTEVKYVDLCQKSRLWCLRTPAFPGNIQEAPAPGPLVIQSLLVLDTIPGKEIWFQPPRRSKPQNRK